MEDNYQKIVENLLRDANVDIGAEPLLELLKQGERHHIEAKKYMLSPDVVDTNIYVILEGVARLAYKHEGHDEVTTGFATEGTLLLSPLSYVMNKPAFYHVITITACTVLVISKEVFEKMLLQSPELSFVMLRVALCQFCACELKQQWFIGDASEKYDTLINKKYLERVKDFTLKPPDFLSLVSDKVMASYLGIHPVHFSRMKHNFIEEERAKNRAQGK